MLIDDSERRRRLATRHGLTDEVRPGDPAAAARCVVALHGTDPASIVLSAKARCPSLAIDDVEESLHSQRSIVRVMGMRRTIWVVPTDLVPAAVGGPGARVARTERKRLISDVEAHGLHADGERWLASAAGQVLDALADGGERSMDQIRSESPGLVGSYRNGIGKKWESEVSIGPRVLTWMWADGAIVRSGNDGSWRSARPLWSAADRWIDAGPPLESAPAWTELVTRWLARFGPGTEADIMWWLGATKGIVRTALAECGAQEVSLSDGSTGWVLANDTGPTSSTKETGDWGALLPALDPTTMGWKSRDWYMGQHAPHLVDSAGNAGPTVWWDGRIVGGWHQSEDGAVGLAFLEDVGADAASVLEAHAESLETWLGGQRVLMRFPSPLFQRSTGRPVRR